MVYSGCGRQWQAVSVPPRSFHLRLLSSADRHLLFLRCKRLERRSEGHVRDSGYEGRRGRTALNGLSDHRWEVPHLHQWPARQWEHTWPLHTGRGQCLFYWSVIHTHITLPYIYPINQSYLLSLHLLVTLEIWQHYHIEWSNYKNHVMANHMAP